MKKRPDDEQMSADAGRRRLDEVRYLNAARDSDSGAAPKPMSRAWVEAGKQLASNASAVVDCPECGAAKLEVSDQMLSQSHVERHLRCPACGAYNSIYMPRDD